MSCLWSIEWLKEFAERNELKVGFVEIPDGEPVPRSVLMKNGWIEKKK
jgi:hypothetical protein